MIWGGEIYSRLKIFLILNLCYNHIEFELELAKKIREIFSENVNVVVHTYIRNSSGDFIVNIVNMHKNRTIRSGIALK